MTVEAPTEAAAAALIFQAALVNTGIDTVADVLSSWSSTVVLSPAKASSSLADWLADVLSLVGVRRKAVRHLALVFFRYYRALETGFTYPEPGEPAKGTVRLAELRSEFMAEVEQVAPGTLNRDNELVDVNGVVVTDPPPTTDEAIQLEEPDLDIEDLFDEYEDEQAQEAEDRLQVVVRTTESKLRVIDDDEPAKVVDKQRDDIDRTEASKAAAAAERLVLNGGREPLQDLAKSDSRALGWARVSSTGHPCGWCAMLISRGPVYNSKKAGERVGKSRGPRAEGEKYHENCKCFAIPVYSLEEYNSDPRFAFNREMERLWPLVVNGRKGKPALAIWRKYVRHKFR